MISIVVTSYNLEKYIVKCLESIVNQNYKDFELLIIDDGSRDDSVIYAQNFLSDKDVNYKIYKKENGGVSSARNYGLNNSNGEYIVFIDGDDVIAEDFLGSLYKMIDDTDFSFCNYQFVKTQSIESDDINKEVTIYTKDELLEAFNKRTISFLLPSMLFRKDFLLKNNLFFDENSHFSEDQMYIWNVLFSCNKAIYLDRKLYGYFLRENSTMTSSSYEKMENGYIKYSGFVEELKNKYPQYGDTIKYILPRWKLGLLYTSANLLNRNDYLRLYKHIDARQILNQLKGFNEKKAIILGIIAKISANLLYYLCRELNLNG